MTDAVTPVKRPTRVSTALAVGSAALAVSLSARSGVAWLVVLATCGGLALFAVGVAYLRGGRRSLGTGIAVVAALATLATVALGPLSIHDTGEAVGTSIGLVGTSLVGASLLLVSTRWARGLLRIGAGVTFACVLASGVMLVAPRTSLLAAGAAAILSFDFGENAIGLGEQLGRSARTARIELVHAAGSVAAGCVGVGVCLAVRSFGRPGLPLSSFALLLVVTVLFLAALHD